jgi:predicted DCC family thiol-disulfide oxidoreductase YuxK
MKSLREAWRHYFFEPNPPTDLAVSRLLFYGILFFFYLPQDWSVWGEVDQAFWMPIGLFEKLHIPVLASSWLAVLQTVWKCSLALCALGFLTRLSSLTAFVLSVYLLGLPHNFGKTHHYDAMVILILGILAVSRAGDAWSLDRLLALARRRNLRSVEQRPASGEYTWPLRAVWMLMSLIFFAAGMSKIRHSGLAWAFSDTLSTILIQHNYLLSNAAPLSTIGLDIAAHPWLARSFAFATLILELGYPVSLLSKRARFFFVPGIVFMLLGFRILMGPTFYTFIIAQLFWIPWLALGKRLSVFASKTPRLSILYDGSCGLCQGTVAWVGALDLWKRVETLDAFRDWDQIQKRFPRLDQAACMENMHAVTSSGRIAMGFDAYRLLAWQLPLTWITAPFLYLPGVRPLGTRVYARVASRRLRGACAVEMKSRS